MSEVHCRFVASGLPRALVGRHEDDCDDEHCRGCQPCERDHCRICGIEHLGQGQQTCPLCIGEARDNLAEVEHLWRDLLGQAMFGGQNGHLAAAAPIPGSDALVMLSPYSDGTADQLARWAEEGRHLESLESPGDPEPPLLTLGSWEDIFRESLGHGQGPRPATIQTCAAYLSEHLSWAAHHHDAFDEFAVDMRRLRARLEDVLHAGERDEPGVPCLTCGTALVRKADSRMQSHCRGHDGLCPFPRAGCCDRGGLRDEWKCPQCRRKYSYAEYHNAVHASYRANAPALNAEDMQAEYGVKRGTLWAWATRGRVRKRGHDLRGRVLYDVDDTLKCKGSSEMAS